ncbi:hypothetical protein ISCGN_008114 [Ixodes scapularis]
MPKFEAFAGEGSDEWGEYVEVLEQDFIAHDAPAAKQRAVFLSSCGRPTYSLLRKLLVSRRPSEVLLDECLRLLPQHYSPRPSVIVQRYHFYCRAQKEGKAMKDFVAEPRKLADPCSFGQELDNNPRDRLVHGIRDDVMRRRLLEEPELTLNWAVQIVATMEAAVMGAKQVTGQAGESAILRLSKSQRDSRRVSSVRWAAPQVVVQVPQSAVFLVPEEGAFGKVSD